MATLQDFLDLEGARVERGMVIVSTRDGDQAVADILQADELRFSDYGQVLADELDGKSPEPLSVKRKRRAAVADGSPDNSALAE